MRIQSPIAGNQSGSSAGMVFQTYRGRTFMRSKPALFHYADTPAQQATQKKFYDIQADWLPIYRTMRVFFPKVERQGLNYFNTLSKGIYQASKTYPPYSTLDPIEAFGFDIYDRCRITQGALSTIRNGRTYILRLASTTYVSTIDFVPEKVQCLMLCPDLQQLEFTTIDYSPGQLDIPFSNSRNWFPGHTLHLYIAFSNDAFFSNFYF